MRYLLILTASILLTACSNNNSQKASNEDSNTPAELILGERIDGPANFRDTVNGKILFTLNDHVLVETTPTQNHWLLAGIFIKLTPKQIEAYKIFPGSDLISSDGKKVGKVIDTLEIGMLFDSLGQIVAYTNQANIKSNTIPENVLTKLLNQGKKGFGDFEAFMANFKFEKYELQVQLPYKNYFIYESSVVDPSPRDRISLLFNDENSLVGVLHSRKLNAKKFKTFELIRGHKLTITCDMKQTEIEKLIAKQIEFYNSVD